MDRLLRPKSIAVIGGGAWGAAVIARARKDGFTGPIWPVHPKASEVSGEIAYKSIDALPQSPDAAYICVNRHLTIDAVRALSQINAGGAICFASGFSEAVAEDETAGDLQAHLVAAAGSMPIIGPNCYGFVNYLDKITLWPDEHGGVPVDSGVAILTQSSNIAINLSMQKRGLPISYLITVGNQAQTSMAHLTQTLLSDKRVTAIGLHIEGFGDLAAWHDLAQAAYSAGIPIVAIKVGKSEQAQAATISHTASLAGADTGADALLARLGFARVDTIEVFLETLKILHVFGPLANTKIASMSCSGGEASLMADTAVGTEIDFPALNDRQKTDLGAALGPMVALANPLDYHTYIWRDLDAMTHTYAAMSDPDLALTVLVGDFPRSDRCDGTDWLDMIPCLKRAQTRTGHRMALLASMAENLPEDIATQALAAGILPLCGLRDAQDAIVASTRAGRKPNDHPNLWTATPKSSVTLSEADAKKALRAYGLPTAQSIEAISPQAAASAADTLGYPVVLKGMGLAHKSESGAVKLGLTNANDVLEAAKAMPTDTFLVETMITDTICEVLIGVTRDDAHGFILTIGAGGIMTELLKDTQSMLVPVSHAEISEALSKLKISPILSGYRGNKAADHDAIVDAIETVQKYVVTNADRIMEIEINPLMCQEKGAIAADALIIEDTK